MGSPSMNFMRATLERDGAGLVCLIGEQRLTVSPETAASRPELKRYVGGTLGAGIRSEHVQDAAVATGAPPGQRLRGEVVTTSSSAGSPGLRRDRSRPGGHGRGDRGRADIDVAAADGLVEEAARRRTPVVGRFNIRSKPVPAPSSRWSSTPTISTSSIWRPARGSEGLTARSEPWAAAPPRHVSPQRPQHSVDQRQPVRVDSGQ